MKVKKEYLVLLVIIVALSLYLVLRNPDRTYYQLPKVPDAKKADISKIEIIKNDTSVVLEKRDNRWRVSPQGYPADLDKVNGMLDALDNLTLTALVSEKKDYNRYDLNKDKAITVKAWTGNTMIRDFELGKTAPSYRHTFVKLAGDDRVYHARGNFRWNFDQTVDNLLDKTILSFDLHGIDEIRFTKGRESTTFSRKSPAEDDKAGQKDAAQSSGAQKSDRVWQSAEGKRVDESKINPLLTTLSRLRCDRYVENRKKETYHDPIYTVTLKGEKEYTLSIFAKEGEASKQYPAISSESAYPFVLTEQQAEKIMVDPGKWLKKAESKQKG
jgi:hypothetical protein